MSPSIQKLIGLFSKFPTIGPRTAGRFVFYLLSLSESEIEELISSIQKVKKETKFCQFCFNPFENENSYLCEICQNSAREQSLLCVVEKESDIEAIEKTKIFKGRYFILGGTISPIRKTNLSKLKIKELQERINKNPQIKEIILALNPTTEGEATTIYLENVIKKELPKGIKTTRLARGLPVGAELEYADEETISSALENRR